MKKIKNKRGRTGSKNKFAAKEIRIDVFIPCAPKVTGLGMMCDQSESILALANFLPTFEIWDEEAPPPNFGPVLLSLGVLGIVGACHGERSRSQLLFKLAGTGTRLILGWLFKFGC